MRDLSYLLGALLGLTGATCLYLGSRKQALLSKTWPAARAWGLGGAGLAASAILLVAALSFTAGLYVLLTLLMAVFSAAPFAALAIKARRGRKP